jgi:sorting nexin-3/12
MSLSKANPLLIEVSDPQNHIQGSKKFTDYLVRTKTTLPIFTVKEFSVRRRFSDFEWLRTKIESQLKITPPPLPDKAWKRQIPFMKDNLFDDHFVEERRRALEHFINK